ncbi:MAG: adenylate cyclase [Mycobacterium sp.]|nr:adenylate cyclase [Mycobacterium sp.]
MDRIWQWAWDRHGARYSWAICAISLPSVLLAYLSGSLLVVAVEGSDHYVEAATVTVIAAPVLVYVVVLPGLRGGRMIEQWAAGREIDRATALESTYALTRRAVLRGVACGGVWCALLSVIVGEIAGATGSRLLQYGILGAAVGTAAQLTGTHSLQEAAMRPVRVALAGDTAIGDSLPRARPTFATWSSVLMLALVFLNVVSGGMLATVVYRTRQEPLVFVVIACAVTVGFGVPLAVGTLLSPLFQPIRDLSEGTKRVAAGDYSQRLPVVHDDDLGTLAASFNRMQAGLAERQRLQAAFGTYVDPSLAVRLLEQGDDVFSGERREVTVMFVDVRDFTPFAEANTAEDTVARLNALFEIVVPAVVDAGGHINKFLGDGALAVFGAPNDLPNHADAAMNAALLIHRLVAVRFGNELRIGTGINTGKVIAGTIGGGSKLEFTLIGDAVNVAARVEQLTKTIGDAILLTHQTVTALASAPPGLTDRGFHVLKGKSATVQVFGLGQETVDLRR